MHLTTLGATKIRQIGKLWVDVDIKYIPWFQAI